MKKIYYNGTILTMDSQSSTVEAVLTENGIIAELGKSSTLIAAHPDAEKIDLHGQTMLPGFIDSHSHMALVAMNRLMADLRPESGINTISDLVQRLKDFLGTANLDENEWLIGMGYDETSLVEGRHPTKDDLDKVSLEKPIVCVHFSGHICVANSKALEAFGYYKGCPEVEGGIIRRVGNSDEPNGVLEETAFQSVAFTKAGFPTPEKMAKAIIETEKMYASFGYTTASEISCLTSNVNILLEMANKQMHIMDVVAHCLNLDDISRIGCNRNYVNHFRINGAKLVLDGSPQAKTAWLSQPYYKVPKDKDESYCGYPSVNDEDLYEWLCICIQNGWSVHLHCNGDAASEQFIRVYEKVWREAGCPSDRRPVMIHCQTVRDDQLDRMKQLGILATFFIGHVYYWGDLHYESVLGPVRANRISPIRSAVQKNINYTIHQDSPITEPNMMLSIHTAVNRQTSGGRILGLEQCVSVKEALRAATINAAFQYFEENRKGSIEKGKLADFVILDKNPLAVKKEEIKNIRVVQTIKEDRVIFDEKFVH